MEIKQKRCLSGPAGASGIAISKIAMSNDKSRRTVDQRDNGLSCDCPSTSGSELSEVEIVHELSGKLRRGGPSGPLHARIKLKSIERIGEAPGHAAKVTTK